MCQPRRKATIMIAFLKLYVSVFSSIICILKRCHLRVRATAEFRTSPSMMEVPPPIPTPQPRQDKRWSGPSRDSALPWLRSTERVSERRCGFSISNLTIYIGMAETAPPVKRTKYLWGEVLYSLPLGMWFNFRTP